MSFLKPLKTLSISNILTKFKDCEAVNLNPSINITITAASTIEAGGDGDVCFVSNTKYAKFLQSTKASLCVIGQDLASIVKEEQKSINVALLVCKNPYFVFSQIVSELYGDGEYCKQDFPGFVSPKASVHSGASIDASAKICDFAVIEDGAVIGKNVVVMPHAFIGKGCIIGDGSYIYDNVSIYYTKIGKDCVIRSGVRIGQLGFGFAPDGRGGSLKNQHICGVIIGNRVDIGANTTIDRGYLQDTKIGDDTKIDNSVVIGHGAVIGNGCFFAGNSCVAGSTIVGNYVVCGGHAGIAGHIKIADMIKIAGNSGVTKDLNIRGETYGGFPAQPASIWRKQTAFANRLFKKSQKIND